MIALQFTVCNVQYALQRAVCPSVLHKAGRTPPPPRRRGSRRLQIWVKIQTEPTSPCGNNGDIFIRIRGASADAQMHKSTKAKIHKCSKLNPQMHKIKCRNAK